MASESVPRGSGFLGVKFDTLWHVYKEYHKKQSVDFSLPDISEKVKTGTITTDDSTTFLKIDELSALRSEFFDKLLEKHYFKKRGNCMWIDQFFTLIYLYGTFVEFSGENVEMLLKTEQIRRHYNQAIAMKPEMKKAALDGVRKEIIEVYLSTVARPTTFNLADVTYKQVTDYYNKITAKVSADDSAELVDSTVLIDDKFWALRVTSGWIDVELEAKRLVKQSFERFQGHAKKKVWDLVDAFDKKKTLSDKTNAHAMLESVVTFQQFPSKYSTKIKNCKSPDWSAHLFDYNEYNDDNVDLGEYARSDYYNLVFQKRPDFARSHGDDDHNDYGDVHILPVIKDVKSGGAYERDLVLGGVIGSSAIIVVLLVFCIGLAFGMVTYWGYTQKKALEKSKDKANDEDCNL
eukprot:468889_1